MNSKQNNFHTLAIDKGIKAGAKIWVKRKKPRRDVDYKFYVHYHPYTDELIEKLNRDGLPALLDVN